uniref:Photosystem II assembly protein Ycf48 n=1 Tax=Cyanoptyche gloeocystis TaxID=77922 RepID=A0A3G1IWH9_9EUKA|nr:photosynthesis system II assembly factor Ycf48 [Cyanoptyche gloeocystis]
MITLFFTTICLPIKSSIWIKKQLTKISKLTFVFFFLQIFTINTVFASPDFTFLVKNNLAISDFYSLNNDTKKNIIDNNLYYNSSYYNEKQLQLDLVKTDAINNKNYWKQIELETKEILLDIAFVPTEPSRGWLVGTKSTLLETTDKGKTWQLKSLNLEEDKYRLNGISFVENEGWVTGQPSILFHTLDGGSVWTRIPFNTQFAGDPILITAVDKGKAEIVTEFGVIYETTNSGQNWKAKVKEPLGKLRNVARSQNGSYVAVSATGSFYATWQPGDSEWNFQLRQSSRRIQTMGFTQDNHLWMLTRGGQLWINQGDSINSNEWQEPINPEGRLGVGLLNLAYHNPKEIWIVGGSGALFYSLDGGLTWNKDFSTENIPSNFYKITFVDPQLGFVLGNQGTLLRYETDEKVYSINNV